MTALNASNQTTASKALLLAYFGRWPSWMPYFLASCEANPDFHWHIFSDIGPLPVPSRNVFVHSVTMQDLKERASALLGFEVNLQHAYKVCELKPLYGDLFSEVVAPYEYWGYTDLDVVYGNLSAFVNKHTLGDCDVFSAAASLIAGHFTLFRNNPEINALYRGVPDLQKIMQEYECVAFDEKAFASHLNRAASAGHIKVRQAGIQLDDCHCFQHGRNSFLILRWGSKLFDLAAFREIAYYHFIQTKYSKSFTISQYKAHSAMVMDQNGIRSLAGAGGILMLAPLSIPAFFAALPWYARRLAAKILPKRINGFFKKNSVAG